MGNPHLSSVSKISSWIKFQFLFKNESTKKLYAICWFSKNTPKGTLIQTQRTSKSFQGQTDFPCGQAALPTLHRRVHMNGRHSRASQGHIAWPGIHILPFSKGSCLISLCLSLLLYKKEVTAYFMDLL